MSNFNELIEELKRSDEELKKAQAAANEQQKKVEEVKKQASESFAKQIEEQNKKNQETAELLRGLGVGTAVSEHKEQKTKSNSKIKNFIIYTLVGTMLAGGAHHLVKDGLGVRFIKTNNKVTTNTNTKFDFNKLVAEYMTKNPTVTEEAARKYIALCYQDELAKTNPDLLFELTGIYEYVELTDKAFEELVNKTFADLRNKGVKVEYGDVQSFVAIINIDQLATDNPELLASLKGNSQTSEFIEDALKVTSAIKTRNTYLYKETKSTKNLISASDYVFDRKTRADLLTIEAYADKANAAKENKTEQDRIISELMTSIYTGELADMEDGIGFASTIAFDSMINYISFNKNNTRIISKENYDALMLHNKLGAYLPNIYGNLNKCDTKTLKK